MATLPHTAHGDKLPIVKINEKKTGTGADRRSIGSELHVLLLFDSCAHVPITIEGLDSQRLPAPDIVTERNMRGEFLVGQFRNLVIEFWGGDYGAVRYRGKATGVEFLNLTSAPEMTTTATAKKE